MMFDYTLRTVMLGAAVLGATSGALGSFALLRRQSLLGDAVSHAALPGIALAFLVTGSKASLVLMAGAALTGWLATLAVGAVVRHARIKYDGALALFLAVFFGLGLMLLTFVQRQPGLNAAGLDAFLFGQAATLVTDDVIAMSVLGAVAVGVLLAGWSRFKLLAFDPAFLGSLGVSVRGLDLLLTTLLVLAIVMGLQTVGVVLMSALVVAPAAAARQWTDRLGTMTSLAALFGALAGVAGAVLSSTMRGLPTGPTIVLCATVLVAVSLLAAPRRGLIAQAFRHRRNARRLRLDATLLDLYALQQQHDDPGYAHEEAALDAMSARSTRQALEALEEIRLVEEPTPGCWALTPEGRDRAQHLAQGLSVDGH